MTESIIPFEKFQETEDYKTLLFEYLYSILLNTVDSQGIFFDPLRKPEEKGQYYEDVSKINNVEELQLFLKGHREINFDIQANIEKFRQEYPGKLKKVQALRKNRNL